MSEQDRVRWGRLGVDYARNVEDPEAATDENLSVVLKVNYARELVAIPEADRKEAVALMIAACKRRLASMHRKTVQVRRGER